MSAASPSGTPRVIEGDAVRTGVTVVVPHGGNVFQEKVPGAVFVGNAFGKLAGSTQVDELGTIETPIALTNTLSVGAAMDGLVRWTLDQPGNQNVRSVNALVGETNDGGLNDIRGQHVRPQHVLDALKAATRPARCSEGSVGAGTGTQAFGWKGGIGTARASCRRPSGGYTLGVLVQSNFGGVLTMGGAPVGKLLGRYSFQPTDDRSAADDDADGSCMIVVATDAPLDARDLKRARRARDLRAGPHRFVLQQRQRRFRDRLFDRRRPAHALRILRGAGANAAAGRRRLAAVPGRTRSDRRGGLQLAAEGYCV